MGTIDFDTLLGGGVAGAREETVARHKEAVSLTSHLNHLSASSIGMLMRCPRQFQHRYLRGEKERPGESLVIGGSFHNTLEWNYLTKIQSHVDQPIEDALQYFYDVAMPKAIEENGGADNIKWDDKPEAAVSDAERITAAYYRHVVPRIQPTATEQKFTIEVPGVEVPVIGYIDVQEEDRVLDTKTGKQASRKVKPSWMLQGRTYSFAVQKPTEFHSVSRAKTPTIVTALESSDMIVPVPTETQMGEFTHLVNVAADLIRHFLDTYGVDDEWPTWGAIPDWSRNVLPCDMCGWRQGCPAWS
jgi:PD-(D/E)XK nuclease superfamily